MARARRFLRRLERVDGGRPPLPPPGLPPGRVVDVAERGEMFVRDTGDTGSGGAGQPVIALLHGWTVSADLNWFRTYDVLAPFGRVVAPDHRGHGRGIRTEQRFTLEDAADDLAALLRTIGATPAVLVGFSMGGPIALLTTQRHPDVVRGLVLQATALEWRATWHERLGWKTMAALEWFLRLGRPRGFIDRTLRDLVDQQPDLEPFAGWLKGELRRGDPEALADAGRALGDYDFRPHVAAVGVPAAVVVTTKDRQVRTSKQRELAAALPDARVYELRGDHAAPAVLSEAFPRVTADAVEWVLSRTWSSTTTPTNGRPGAAGTSPSTSPERADRR